MTVETRAQIRRCFGEDLESCRPPFAKRKYEPDAKLIGELERQGLRCWILRWWRRSSSEPSVAAAADVDRVPELELELGFGNFGGDRVTG